MDFERQKKKIKNFHQNLYKFLEIFLAVDQRSIKLLEGESLLLFIKKLNLSFEITSGK